MLLIGGTALMKIAGLSLFLFSIVATSAFAEDSIFWKSVGNWDVFVDPSMGNACYAVVSYRDGTILRLGFDFTTDQRSIYIGFGSESWRSLEIGKDYDIVIQFDQNPIWKATATAVSVGPVNYLKASTTDTNFIVEFSRKHAVRAWFEGRQITSLTLSGSAAAISEMLDCQKATNSFLSSAPKQPQSPPDPFETTPGTKPALDPFSL